MGDLKELPVAGRERRFALLEGGRRRLTLCRKSGYHGRHSWVLDEKTRRAECSVCQQVAEPFEVLMELIRDQDHILHMLRDRKHLQENLDRLKAEEKRVKQRLRHVKKRLSASTPGEDHDAQKGGGHLRR